MSVQPALCPGNPVDCDLHVVPCEGDGSLLVFLGVAVLERVRCSPEGLQYKLLIGRLVNAGWSLSALQRHFHHDPRTMKRWAAALLSDDEYFVIQALSGRGANRKITEPVRRYVQRRYRILRGTGKYRQTITQEVSDVFDVVISRESLRQLFRQADDADEQAVPSAGSAEPRRETGCPSHDTSGGCVAHDNDNQSPEFGDLTGLPFTGERAPARPVGVHHAGMVLFAVLLMRFFQGRSGEQLPWQSQWLGQILQGAVNIEQSRLITADDLARFVGPVAPETNRQREQLRELAGPEAVLDVYKANARLLSDGPGRGNIFYYDPHSKEYTGELKVLKDWCGRRHGVSKVVHMDMIHTRGGRPCFTQHYSPYYDLRERFFMTLAQFDSLFAPQQRSGRAFVLDRGIYGLETFARFISSGDHFVTWEKGYGKNGWDDEATVHTFSRVRVRNRADDLKRYTFRCQEHKWHRDARVRRIVVRATNSKNRTIEVSILCSSPDLTAEEAVWLMFQRWLQENNFKYLDKHFGLNQLTSYASKPVSEANLVDKDIDSVEYRELKSELKRVETELAKCLLQREKARDELAATAKVRAGVLRVFQRHLRKAQRDLETLCTDEFTWALAETLKRQDPQVAETRKNARKVKETCQRLEKKLAQLAVTIDQLKSQCDDLQRCLCEAVRQQSRLQLLIDNQYQLLDTRCKALLDAVRVTAANMFADLAGIFRPIYGNYRNDHVMLRNLTRADGFLHQADGVIHVRLWLKGRFQPRQLKAFNEFLADITQRINRDRPAATPVWIYPLREPPTW